MHLFDILCSKLSVWDDDDPNRFPVPSATSSGNRSRAQKFPRRARSYFSRVAFMGLHRCRPRPPAPHSAGALCRSVGRSVCPQCLLFCPSFYALHISPPPTPPPTIISTSIAVIDFCMHRRATRRAHQKKGQKRNRQS